MSSEGHPAETYLAGASAQHLHALKVFGTMRPCGNCVKTGLDMQKCSRCKQIYYCSKECQTVDWKKHKKICKRLVEMRQEARESVGAATEKLRNKWYKSSGTLFAPMLCQCYSEDVFNEQPPKLELVLCVKFNCNYGTYMPLGPPMQLPIDRHHPTILREVQSNYEEAKKKCRSSKERTHFIHIVFENDVMHMICNVDPDGVETTCRDLGLSASEYSHETFCKLLQEVDLPSSVYSPLIYRSMIEANLAKEFDFFMEATMGINKPWERFVLNAYRMNERKSLRGTHAVFVYFLFDFVPGKMRTFTRYEVLTMEEAKEKIPAEIRGKYLCLDTPSRLPVILVEDWSKDVFATSSEAFDPPGDFEHWPAEQSSEVADRFFEELKDLTFPLAGLEIPPVIG